MNFLTPFTYILHGERPIDMNDRKMEHTAVELALPTNFSEKAKHHFNDYYYGTAFIYEYKGHLVVTDESLYLTEHGDGTHDAPFGGPRWICNSWEELEKVIEDNYDELAEATLLW